MLTTDWRSSTIALFANYGARVKMVYCEAPTFKETLQRNKNRDKVVPENKIQSMLEKLEIPSIHEAHEVVYNLK
jgi:predicted kinase